MTNEYLPNTRDNELRKFQADSEGNAAVNTIQNGRFSTPTSADFLAAFNPMALPLLPFNRAIEVTRNISTDDFATGIYAISSTYIQYYISIQIYPYYDAMIVTNNIIRANDVAIKLNITKEFDSPVDIAAFTDFFMGVH